MSLADHWDDEPKGDFLREGRHIVNIQSYRFYSCKTGSRGVEFQCANSNGKNSISFTMIGDGLGRLLAFAKVADVTRTEAATCQPSTETGFDIFVNKRVGLVVKKNDDGFHEGKNFFKPNGDEKPQIPQPSLPPEPVPVDASGPMDEKDIPF